MNRRLLPLATIGALAAVALSACSATEGILESFGPSPNPTVLQLAQDTEAEASQLPDESAATLRHEQANRLYNEVTRLCGIDDAGEVPSSCDFERADADANEPDYAAALQTSPEESRDLIASLAVEWAATSATGIPPAPELSDEEQATAQTLLSAEYATSYGLDVAQAFAADDTADLIRQLEDHHDARILLLREALGDNAPAPAAAYSFDNQVEPVDAATAHDFVVAQENNLATAWTDAVSSVSEGSFPWFVALAGQQFNVVQENAPGW